MKDVFKTILIATSLIFITACGSSGDGSSEEIPTVIDDNQTLEENTTSQDGNQSGSDRVIKRVITGLVVDGYIKEATVFLDLNDDGELSANEPSSTTDENGSFSLNYDGTDNPTLVSVGGIDVDTNRPFEGRLKAPLESEDLNITPITTIISEYMRDMNQSIDVAKSKISGTLGIPSESLFKDPIKVAKTENDNSLLSSCWQIEQGLDVLRSGGGESDQIYKAFTSTIHEMPEDRGSVADVFENMLQSEKSLDILGEDLRELSKTSVDISRNIDDLLKTDLELSKDSDMLKVTYAIYENIDSVKENIESGNQDYTLISVDNFAEFDHREVIARDIIKENNLSEDSFSTLLENIEFSEKPDDILKKIEKDLIPELQPRPIPTEDSIVDENLEKIDELKDGEEKPIANDKLVEEPKPVDNVVDIKEDPVIEKSNSITSSDQTESTQEPEQNPPATTETVDTQKDSSSEINTETDNSEDNQNLSDDEVDNLMSNNTIPAPPTRPSMVQ